MIRQQNSHIGFRSVQKSATLSDQLNGSVATISRYFTQCDIFGAWWRWWNCLFYRAL